MDSRSPKLRLLCLHGGRTSGDIFKYQLRALVAQLGDTAEFVFVDGRVRVQSSAPEVMAAFPESAFYQHLERVVEDKDAETGRYDGIDAGVHWLMELDATRGPFDAWIGFSQGANLIFLTLLTIKSLPERAAAGLPRIAVFLCPSEFGWLSQLAPAQRALLPLDLPACYGISTFCCTAHDDPLVRHTNAFLRECLTPASTSATNAPPASADVPPAMRLATHAEGHRPLPKEPRACAALAKELADFLHSHATSHAQGSAAAAPQ